jgi:hypothetical protein
VAQEVPVVQFDERAMGLQGAQVGVLADVDVWIAGRRLHAGGEVLTFTSVFCGPSTLRKSATGSSHFQGVPRTAP